MKKTHICSMIVLLVFLLPTFFVFIVHSYQTNRPMETINEDGWYYLPSYPNYSPQGLPDFDQKQADWKAGGKWLLIGGLWSFCAPTSLAEIFWWFDSMHENPLGYPGDGNDTYSLVKCYTTTGDPLPGPMPDDHNFNNVNDLATRWKHGRGEKELIEQLAWYCNTNFCRYPFIRGYAGTHWKFLENGAEQWIQDAGLQDKYTVESVWNPDFSLIVQKLQNNSGIILNLLLYNSDAIFFQTFLGHYVAIAGIHPNGSIALSDPFQNTANPSPTPADHNDASIVSHDIYLVNFTSPFPEKASWWLMDYFDFGVKKFGGLAWYALIITEIDE
jgi:hypothetical protein